MRGCVQGTTTTPPTMLQTSPLRTLSYRVRTDLVDDSHLPLIYLAPLDYSSDDSPTRRPALLLQPVSYCIEISQPSDHQTQRLYLATNRSSLCLLL